MAKAKSITSRRFYYNRPQYEFASMGAALKAARVAMKELQKRFPEVKFSIHDNGDYLQVSSGNPVDSSKEVK